MKLQRIVGGPGILLSGLLGLSCFVTSASAAELFLNEVNVRDPESIELYNANKNDTLHVGGFEIQGTDGTFVIPPGTVIPPDSYRIFLPSISIFPDLNGETGLIDPIAPDDPVDFVSYGQAGSAPAPHLLSPFAGGENAVLVRAPDPAETAPGPPDPATDGLFWTLDLTPTPGGQNDAPAPDLGSSIILNEINAFPDDGAGDSIELFNAGEGPVDLTNFIITTGQTFFELPSEVIPVGEFFNIQVPAGIELEETGLLYLFDGIGIRIDQIAFWDAPPLRPSECFGRCPDGEGPNLGYDFATSGGGVDFFGLPCTLGSPNSNTDCRPTPVFHRSWGWIKSQHR